jgi:hypothetical protein
VISQAITQFVLINQQALQLLAVARTYGQPVQQLQQSATLLLRVHIL